MNKTTVYRGMFEKKLVFTIFVHETEENLEKIETFISAKDPLES